MIPPRNMTPNLRSEPYLWNSGEFPRILLRILRVMNCAIFRCCKPSATAASW